LLGKKALFETGSDKLLRLSTDLEDELTPEMPPLTDPMCVGSLRQTIELDLGSAYGTNLKKFSDALEMPARGRREGVAI
jgi:hypothetical protein